MQSYKRHGYCLDIARRYATGNVMAFLVQCQTLPSPLFYSLIAPNPPQTESRSVDKLVVKLNKLADTTHTYDYKVTCKDEKDQTCLGVCDQKTELCEMTGLQSANQYMIAVVACYTPTGSNVSPICGSPSTDLIEWSLPSSK